MAYLRKFTTQTDIKKWIRENESTVKRLYVKKGLTARKLAENQNVEYDKRFQKILGEIFPKDMGRGGVRIGSGNKKGKIKFCGVCRKQTKPQKKCLCEPKET